jgi:hypothetical protein
MTKLTYEAFHENQPAEGPEPHVSATGETPAPAPNTPSLPVKLETTTAKALDKLNEVLDLPVTPGDGVGLRAIVAASNVALSTQVKVDEQRLRERHGSRGVLDELIKRIEQVDAERIARGLLTDKGGE